MPLDFTSDYDLELYCLLWRYVIHHFVCRKRLELALCWFRLCHKHRSYKQKLPRLSVLSRCSRRRHPLWRNIFSSTHICRWGTIYRNRRRRRNVCWRTYKDRRENGKVANWDNRSRSVSRVIIGKGMSLRRCGLCFPSRELNLILAALVPILEGLCVLPRCQLINSRTRWWTHCNDVGIMGFPTVYGNPRIVLCKTTARFSLF